MKISVGPAMLLFFIFLTLKLCKVITWSWLWVTAPLWGVLALCAVVFVLIVLGGLVVNFFTERF